jgi:hypothetical protein
MMMIMMTIIIIYLTANGFSPGGSGYKNRKKRLKKRASSITYRRKLIFFFLKPFSLSSYKLLVLVFSNHFSRLKLFKIKVAHFVRCGAHQELPNRKFTNTVPGILFRLGW